jgi:2-keto-4-pentenoate hydratase/2-oxohepta-3-ene-1,7-dioic acid hydratase in catechol pathway
VSTWQLVTVSIAEGTGAALVAGSHTYRPDWLVPYDGAMAVVLAWHELEERLRAWRPDDEDRLECATLLQPLQHPRKVLCSGPNFSDHLAEMGETGLGDAWTAYFFLKPPTTTMIASGEPVLVDDPERDRVDYEGELALVIGRGGRDIPVESALDHVAGYLAANDISLRGPHHRDTPARPFQWDWLASKGADTSLPIGPGVVPHWQVPDPQSLTITTTVNGVVRQCGTTADMILDVARLVSDASRSVTLEVGDVILTGTPAGVGASTREFLAAGDVVEVEVEGVGRLSNPIQLRRKDIP